MTPFSKYEQGGAYHWGKLAGRGLRSYHARLWARYGWFVDEARRAHGGLIVDVGCGDAALTHLLEQATQRDVMGVEPEPAGVGVANAALSAVRSSARVVIGSGGALPVEDGTASVVVLCEVLEHVEDPERVLAEAARVLLPDGVLLLSTPQRQEHEELPPFHIREYGHSELAAVCRRFFSAVTVQVSEPPWLLQAYATRPGRALANALALAGFNLFAMFREASARPRWRQLYAVAHEPRRNAL
jgi:SAM-dependent methyltransferase